MLMSFENDIVCVSNFLLIIPLFVWEHFSVCLCNNLNVRLMVNVRISEILNFSSSFIHTADFLLIFVASVLMIIEHIVGYRQYLPYLLHIVTVSF